MKFIAKKNLLAVLNSFQSESVSEGTVCNIMDWYGDTFEKSEDGDWERTHENPEIKKLLGSIYEDLGNKIYRKIEN